MSGPQVVILLFACTRSFLLCEQIPSDHMVWHSIEGCRARLPGLIQQYENTDSRYPLVVGRCQLLLTDPPGFSTGVSTAEISPP